MTYKDRRPTVNDVRFNDIVASLKAGVKDFRRAPVFGLCLAGIYVLGGWFLFTLLNFFDLPYFAYPLAVGFALVAPFVAMGFYAVSSHLENGSAPSWSWILSKTRDASRRDIRWMALVTCFALIIWMDIAAILSFFFIGFNGFGVDFFETIFTTSSGLIFLLLGNFVGALISIFIFSITVVSFPMLFDRDVDFITAMITSVRVVKSNPLSMIVWCGTIGLAMGLSVATGLLGLFLVLPIVGHASWHLYRHAVGPSKAETTIAAA
ncbi:MAG: membrane protein [Hyphococcus sp.]|nr:MAG: membrane protein [Marinicaulis sp.]